MKYQLREMVCRSGLWTLIISVVVIACCAISAGPLRVPF